MTALRQHLVVALLALGIHLASAQQRPLTPQKFIEDNREVFEIIHTATTRVGYLGGFINGLLGPYQDGKGATFILPLDEGFVAASNRTVEEMVAEVEGSTISALEFWLGQWIIPELLPTPDALLDVERAKTISGQVLTFTRAEEGGGVVVSLEGQEQGAGGILAGGIPIKMGPVVTYVLGPL